RETEPEFGDGRTRGQERDGGGRHERVHLARIPHEVGEVAVAHALAPPAEARSDPRQKRGAERQAGIPCGPADAHGRTPDPVASSGLDSGTRRSQTNHARNRTGLLLSASADTRWAELRAS